MSFAQCSEQFVNRIENEHGIVGKASAKASRALVRLMSAACSSMTTSTPVEQFGEGGDIAVFCLSMVAPEAAGGRWQRAVPTMAFRYWALRRSGAESALSGAAADVCRRCGRGGVRQSQGRENAASAWFAETRMRPGCEVPSSQSRRASIRGGRSLVHAIPAPLPRDTGCACAKPSRAALTPPIATTSLVCGK